MYFLCQPIVSKSKQFLFYFSSWQKYVLSFTCHAIYILSKPGNQVRTVYVDFRTVFYKKRSLLKVGENRNESNLFVESILSEDMEHLSHLCRLTIIRCDSDIACHVSAFRLQGRFLVYWDYFFSRSLNAQACRSDRFSS